mgnify:CR=1 FL=1
MVTLVPVRVDGRDISVTGSLLQPLTRRTNEILRVVLSAAFLGVVITSSLITRNEWVSLERSVSEIIGVLTPTQSNLVYLAYGVAILALPFVVAAAIATYAFADREFRQTREMIVGAGLVEEPPHEPRRDALAAALGRDRDVHQVPDVRISRADQVADQAALAGDREADPRGLRELEHEHRQRPGRLE